MKEINLKNHIPELTFAGIVILISFFPSELNKLGNDAWLISICATLISINTLIIKHHQQEIFSNKISKIISGLTGISFEYANNLLKYTVNELENIQNGEITINESTYYTNINNYLKCTKSNVCAVFNENPILWSEDTRQSKYLEENKKALNNGVIITRIFIVDKSLIKTKEIFDNIREQINLKNLKIYIVWLEELEKKTDIKNEDWVYYEKENIICQVHRNDIFAAKLYINKDDITEKIENFEKLKGIAIHKDTRNKIFNIKKSDRIET